MSSFLLTERSPSQSELVTALRGLFASVSNVGIESSVLRRRTVVIYIISA